MNISTKELFEKETKLRLTRNYNSSNSNTYYETSGKSYKLIKSKVKDFNNTHNGKVYCYDDPIKDVTIITL